MAIHMGLIPHVVGMLLADALVNILSTVAQRLHFCVSFDQVGNFNDCFVCISRHNTYD